MNELVVIAFIIGLFVVLGILAWRGTSNISTPTATQDLYRRILEDDKKYTWKTTVKKWYTTHLGNNIHSMVTIPVALNKATDELDIKMKDVVSDRLPRRGDLILVIDNNNTEYVCSVEEITKDEVLKLLVL